MNKNRDLGTGHTGRLLREEILMAMIADLSIWRMDNFVRQMEKERKRGRIFS